MDERLAGVACSADAGTAVTQRRRTHRRRRRARAVVAARAVRTYLDHLRGRARAGRQHPEVLPARPAAVRRLARRPGRRRPRRRPRGRPSSAFLVALREGDAGPPAARARRRRPARSSRCAGFHRFAVRDGLTAVDPSAAVRPPAPAKRLPKALPLADIEGILEAAGAPGTALALRDRALLEVLYGTGARISEAVGLDVDDLDLGAGHRAAARQGQQGADRPGRLLRPRGGRAPTWSAAAPSCRRPGAGAAGDVPQRPRRPAVAAERLDGAGQGRRAGRGDRARCRRTRCGTRSPPTCSTAAPTSGWSRSCSGTPR